MEKVFIALLAGGNVNNTSITDLWGRLPFYSADPSIPYEFIPHIESGVRGQELGRNRIVKAFLESDCEILWQIDDDMRVYSPETLTMLDSPGWDVLAPVQFMFDMRINEDTGATDPAVQACVFKKNADGNHRFYLGRPDKVPHEAVDAIGGGCFAVRRHVLEDERMHLAQDCDPPAMFRTVVEPNYSRITGNDIDFCERARACGYTVKVCWRVMTGHLKTVDLMAVEMYAKAQWKLGFDTASKRATAV